TLRRLWKTRPMSLWKTRPATPKGRTQVRALSQRADTRPGYGGQRADLCPPLIPLKTIPLLLIPQRTLRLRNLMWKAATTARRRAEPRSPSTTAAPAPTCSPSPETCRPPPPQRPPPRSATAPRPKTCASEPPRSPRKDSPHDRPRHPARRRHRRPRAGPPHPRQPGPRRPRRAGRRVRARPVRRGLAAHPPPAAHPAPPRRRPALGRMAQGRRPHPQPHRGGRRGGAMTPRLTTYLEHGRPVCPQCGYDVDTQG